MAGRNLMLQAHHFREEATLAHALSDALAHVLSEAIRARGQASLAVSGGRSPVRVFEALRQASLDWSKISLTLVDERWVPETHPDSNAALVNTHLRQGAATASRFIPLYTGAPSPQEGLSACQQALQTLPQPLDAVLLGMGEDGHTASFFPQSPQLQAALHPAPGTLCAAVDPVTAAHARITLTLPVIQQARHRFLQFSGAAKDAIFAKVLALKAPDPRWPVSFVLCDPKAATPIEVYRS